MTDALDLDAVERRIAELAGATAADQRVGAVVYWAWAFPVARLVHRQARECEGCGGTGEYAYRTIDGTLRLRRCSVCASARAALAAIVGEQ